MTDTQDNTHHEVDASDVEEALYHEAQADGVPYDEDLEPRARVSSRSGHSAS